MSLAELSADGFRECLNQTFRISSGDQFLVEVALIDVRGLGGHTRRADKTPFSILFHTSENLPLAQSVYRVENEAMGTFDLFLVSVGPDPDEGGMCYEAIFT